MRAGERQPRKDQIEYSLYRKSVDGFRQQAPEKGHDYAPQNLPRETGTSSVANGERCWRFFAR